MDNTVIQQFHTSPGAHHKHPLSSPSPISHTPPTSLLVTIRLFSMVKNLFHGLSLIFLIGKQGNDDTRFKMLTFMGAVIKNN